MREKTTTNRNGRRLGLWLVLAVLAGAPAGAAVDAPDPSRSALLAMLHEGDFAGLEAGLAQIRQAQARGGGTDMATLRALAAFESADPALEAPLNAWVERDPESPTARLARAAHHRHLWRLMGPDRDGTPTDRGLDHFYLARADLVAALKSDPAPGVAYAMLVDLARARHDPTTADQLARAGLGADPRSHALRRAYLRALEPWWRPDREPAEVLADLDAFVAEVGEAAADMPALRPLGGYAHFVTAELLRRQRRHNQAEPYYQAALAFGEDWEYLRQRGANAFAIQRHADALAYVERALALRPEDPSLLDWRARIRQATGDKRAALADWAAALALDPWNPVILLHQAEALRDLGRGREARADLDRALRYGAHDPRIWAARGGLTLIELRRPRAAAPDLRRAVDLDPGNTDYQYSYARALHSLKACEAPRALAGYQGLCENGGRCPPRRLDWAHQALKVYDDPFLCPVFGMIGP